MFQKLKQKNESLHFTILIKLIFVCGKNVSLLVLIQLISQKETEIIVQKFDPKQIFMTKIKNYIFKKLNELN